MSKAFRNTLLAISLTYIVLGLIQILWPVGSRMVICYIMGAALTLFGIYHIVRYFSADTSYMFPGMGLALGVACTVTGILMIICAKAIVAIFGVVLGICLAAGSTAAVVISAVVMAVAMLFLAAIEVNYSAALYTVLYYDAYTRGSVNDPAPNAYVHDAPVQAQTCDAPANEYAPEAQNEPVTPAEVPEFVEKSDYNETNNTQE